MRHPAPVGRDQRTPRLPAGDQPRADRSLERAPAQPVLLAHAGRQQPDRRPHCPAVRLDRDALEDRADRVEHLRWSELRERSERRAEDRSCQVARDRRRMHRALRREHGGVVRVERVDVRRQQPVRDTERPTQRLRLVVETCPAVARQRLEPRVVRRDRRLDERRVHPQRQLWITRRVARPRDPAMELVQPAHLGSRRRRRAVDDREVTADGPVEPPPRVLAEVRVLGDARRNRGMRDLEQEGAWSGPEQEHRLAIEAPCLAGRAEQARIAALGRQPSPGRRPTTHHASGNAPAASTSLTRSVITNGTSPALRAAWRFMPVEAMSHGMPNT